MSGPPILRLAKLCLITVVYLVNAWFDLGRLISRDSGKKPMEYFSVSSKRNGVSCTGC